MENLNDNIKKKMKDKGIDVSLSLKILKNYNAGKRIKKYQETSKPEN